MKKFSKIGKRVLAFFLVALMNINTYAAVGGNDGSAFVTKAEFDALVNTFNEQMDSYEDGLVSKIDGAISNYLSSLSNVRTMELSTIISGIDEKDRTFINNSAISTFNPGSSDFDIKAGTFGICSWANTTNSNPTGKYSKAGFVRINSYDYLLGNFAYIDKTDTAGMWKVNLRELDINGTKYYSPVAEKNKLIKPIHDLRAEIARIQGILAGENNSLPSTSNWTFEYAERLPGAVSWTGSKLWTETAWTLTHSSTSEESSTDYPYLNLLPGTEYKNAYTHYGIVGTRISQFDSDNYYTQSNFQNANSGCRCCGWDTSDRVTDRYGTDRFTYKFYTQKEYSHSPYDWINYSASNLWGEPVLKKNGIPLFKNKEKGKITIPVSLTSSVGKATVAIRTTPFDQKGISKKTDDDIYWNDDCGGDFDITIEQQNGKDELTYWIKVLPNSTGATTVFNLSGTCRIEVED